MSSVETCSGIHTILLVGNLQAMRHRIEKQYIEFSDASEKINYILNQECWYQGMSSVKNCSGIDTTLLVGNLQAMSHGVVQPEWNAGIIILLTY